MARCQSAAASQQHAVTGFIPANEENCYLCNLASCCFEDSIRRGHLAVEIKIHCSDVYLCGGERGGKKEKSLQL